MFSSSTRATRASKRKKMQDIMDDNCISFGKDGLEADDLLTIGAVLDEMDIKTGDQYLGEVKLMQLELGITWPDTLDRQLAMVKRMQQALQLEFRASITGIQFFQTFFIESEIIFFFIFWKIQNLNGHHHNPMLTCSMASPVASWNANDMT